MISDLTLLFYGLTIGFIASFLGISIIIVATQSIVKRGVAYGIAAALGTILAQGIWATVAAMTMFSGSKNTSFDHYFTWVGIVIIFFISYKILIQKESDMVIEDQSKEIDYSAWLPLLGAGFLLSIAAPQRILFYVGVLSGLGVHLSVKHLSHMVPLVGGVMAGVAIWWVMFLFLMSWVRERISTKHYLWIARSGGALLALMGLSLVVTSI